MVPLPQEQDYLQELGFPGQYPYTRGVQPTMYRGRFWAMRQYAGYASAEESNQRYRCLLDKVSTSMTINAPAAVLLAMVIAVAHGQDVEEKNLRGTIQNNIQDAAYRYQKAVENSEEIIVGVNAYQSDEKVELEPCSLIRPLKLPASES